MPFTYNILEHKKDRHRYIEITGYEGKVRDLVIPDRIDGIAVEAIGNHAFSGRCDIVTASIPDTVRILCAFSFHNCRSLEKIILFDSIDDYYDGVCRQCDSLMDIDITIKRDWYEVIRSFLSDNDKTLRFMIHRKEGTASLTFPEYVYDFSDNTMARTIQFSINGSGYAYRECVDRKSINYREYDKLFEKAVIDGNIVSEDIATGRLLYPCELGESFRTVYEDFAAKDMKNILKRLVLEAEKKPQNLDVIKSLLNYRTAGNDGLAKDDDIDFAIKLASERKLTAVNAVLMSQKLPPGSKELEFKF